MDWELLLAGFGGQGVMLMGQLLAGSGMEEGKEVSWLPSYGPEMRGGTAHCSVILSQEPIGSPQVDSPGVLIVFNQPSMDKFAEKVRPGGLILYDASLISEVPTRDQVLAAGVKAAEIADELGSSRIANMVLFGALVAGTRLVRLETVEGLLPLAIPKHRQELLEVNRRALHRGAQAWENLGLYWDPEVSRV